MSKMRQQLEAVAIEHDGRLWVQAKVAAEITGLHVSYLSDARMHRVERWERSVPRGGAYTRGRMVMLSLDDLVNLMGRRKRCRVKLRWSGNDWRLLYQQVGHRSYDDLARAWKRTVPAIRSAVHGHGYTSHSLICERDRVLSSGDLARLMKVAPGTITYWAKEGGCPHRLYCVGRRTWRPYFDLGAVKTWLPTRRETCLRLRPDRLQLLGIDLAEAA